MALSPLRDGDPRQVGDYALQARIGTGGMGTVFLGVGPRGERAVKVVRPELVADPDARARFAREVAVARRVGSPRVARLVDADPDADVPWFAAEYVEGPNLEEAVRARGPLSADQLRELAASLAAALRDLHAVGVLHRDLKPGNVVLGWDGPRVVDLGVARDELAESTSLTRVGVSVGSPAWMAPEQLLGTPVGPGADVHAWAAVIVFAASGAGPYPGPTMPAFAYQVVHQAPSLTGIPADLVGIVAAALDKDPARRPTAPDLVRVLGAPSATPPEALTAPAPGPAPVWLTTGLASPGGPGGRQEGPPPRRTGLLVGSGVAAVVLVAAVVTAVLLAGGGDGAAPTAGGGTATASASARGTATSGPSGTPTGAASGGPLVGTAASKALCGLVNRERASELLGVAISSLEGSTRDTFTSCTWITQGFELASPLVYVCGDCGDATAFASQRGLESSPEDVPDLGAAAYLTDSGTTLRVSVITTQGVQVNGSFDSDLPDAKKRAVAFMREIVAGNPQA